MSAVYAAWLLLSFACICFAARTALADLRDRMQRRGRSWEIPQQRERNVSGRF